jgi:O-methyltransferase
LLAKANLTLVHPVSIDMEAREAGQDWPAEAETMIGIRRLDNIEYCIETLIADAIPGDLIEAGVWRGGAAIFMRAVLKARGQNARTVWVADSFAGLPMPSRAHPVDEGDRHHTFAQLAVPLEEVQRRFAQYGLLDEHVQFLKGWFKDTLPDAPIDRLALVRLDGDMYGSTIDALNALYPRLSPGGYVIVDDYALKGAREAVNDFRRDNAIEDPIEEIDWTGVFWRRRA